MTLQKKLSIALVPVMLVVAGIIIFLAYLFTRQILSENAYKDAREIANRYAVEVARRLEVPMDTSRALARAFQAAESIPQKDRRAALSGMLEEVLAGDKDFLAVWAVFEPNALDGLDRDFVDVPGSNEKGRFTPCWSRADGAPEAILAELARIVPEFRAPVRTPVRVAA